MNEPASEKGKRILVTGGAGFIGSNLVRYLLGETKVEKVVALDKLTYAGSRINLPEDGERHRFVQGDILDRELMGTLLRTENIDSVLHLAAETHVDRSIDDSSIFVKTNVEGTQVLLEAARRWTRSFNYQHFRFLYVSTDEVYGSLEADDAARVESDPFTPNSPYSASKAAGDHLVRAWYQTYGLPTLTVRPGNTFGPRQFPEKLIPLMLSKLKAGNALPVYGDGKNVRDWLYVEDLCRAVFQVLCLANPGEVFNIGGRNEISNVELVRKLREMVPESASPSEIVFVQDRPGHDRRYALDTSKIQRELKWKPTWSFGDALKETIRWYRDHPEWAEVITAGNYSGERLGFTGQD